MMRQYLEIKEQNKDCIIFFRLGDFYEMFFEDAETASRELELTLTGRDCGLEKRAPMCGVPFHAVETYVTRLVDKGYKVAIVEQLTDPGAKGIVERGITRIVTPGTLYDGSIERTENNFILSICTEKDVYGLAYLDSTTGEFFDRETKVYAEFVAAAASVHCREVILSEESSDLYDIAKTAHPRAFISKMPSFSFDHDLAFRTLTEHFGVHDLSAYEAEDASAGISAAGALLYYVIETQKTKPVHITSLRRIRDGRFMAIDSFTYKNLELTETIREGKKKGSLLWILDKTKTAMGGRLLRTWIDKPLQDKKKIDRRLTAVDELKNSFAVRQSLAAALTGVYDIERLLSRISYGTMDARSALSLKQSIQKIPAVTEALNGVKSAALKTLLADLDPLNDLADLLENAIADDAPISIKESGIIKTGFNDEVDKLRDMRDNGKNWLLDLERRERESTGIKNLKISYNKVFGYYIEVTRSFLDKVPYTYTRKQTLVGAERFITKELKEIEDNLLNAQDKLSRLEYEIFLSIRERMKNYIERLQADARILAELDVLNSFAQAAYDNGYIRPKITDDGVIDINNGRHPVVERSVNQEFVPNDVYLDTNDNRMMIITGPNMAGKSTFMRQTGLIVLMAHMGCFVPASSASICIVDRVFTRVGASDDLASGRSTFMVEMNELAGILSNATNRSLLILDEIGRGTSTLDGLSIAWATIEYVLSETNIGAKTLFATHYHELTDLEGTLPGMKNYSVTVKEFDDEIIFLHKIKRGGADRSFGIEVARLAGLPDELLKRAKELLYALQSSSNIRLDKIDTDKKPASSELSPEIKSLISSIRNLDINTITPFEALSILNDLKKKVID